MLFHIKSVTSWVLGVVVLMALGAVLTPGTAAAQEESLYVRLGGVYAIAAVADDIVERVLANEIIEANPAVREAHARVSKAGLKYLRTAEQK